MKLGEALIERADLQRVIAQLEKRMWENARVQEGEEPAEDVAKLTFVYEQKMKDLEKLIIRINKTNQETVFGETTLAGAIAQRDCLKKKIGVYRSLRDAASTNERYSNKEIRYVRCLDVGELQQKIDGLSKAYRELDMAMQGHNWATDLCD